MERTTPQEVIRLFSTSLNKNGDKKDLGELYRGPFLVRPGGFEPLAFRVGELRQGSVDRR